MSEVRLLAEYALISRVRLLAIVACGAIAFAFISVALALCAIVMPYGVAQSRMCGAIEAMLKELACGQGNRGRKPAGALDVVGWMCREAGSRLNNKTKNRV